MRTNRLIYAAVLIACLIFSMTYESRISSILLVTVTAYPLLALVLTAAELLSVGVTFCEERSVHEKNQPFELNILVKNRFVFPCVPIEITCFAPISDTGLFAVRHVCASVSPFSRCRLTLSCLHKYRGSYACELHRAAVFDPLRIIRLSKKLKSKTALVILPRKIPMENVISKSIGEQTSARQTLVSTEKEDFSHVRDYAAGDIIQLVHWKLTAKQDELMIKQYDGIGDRRTLILCDYGFDESCPNPPLYADMIIETAISLAMTSSNEGIKATVDFGSRDRSLVCEICDKPTFDRFYELMAVLPQKLDIYDTNVLFDFSGIDLSGVTTLFLVTGRVDGQVLLCAAEASAHTQTVIAYINPDDAPLPEYDESGFLLMNITDC